MAGPRELVTRINQSGSGHRRDATVRYTWVRIPAMHSLDGDALYAPSDVTGVSMILH